MSDAPNTLARRTTPIDLRDGIPRMVSNRKYPVTGRTLLVPAPTPWLRPREAAWHAKVGPKIIYRAVRSGALRAARVGGRKELRIRREWVDRWLERTAATAA